MNPWLMRTLMLLLLLCWLAAPAVKVVPAQVVSARAGVVSLVEGEVQVKRRGETELQRLRAGDKLSSGDVVITGMSGRAEWTLSPDSYLQVGSRSQVRVYGIELDRMHFDIERGRVFAIVENLEKGAALVLDTPPALLNIMKRGRYRVTVAADDSTEAAVARGELRFTDGEGRTVDVATRRRVRFTAAKRRKVWDTTMTTAQP